MSDEQKTDEPTDNEPLTEENIRQIRDALRAAVYDTDMKHNRWGLWTKLKDALILIDPECIYRKKD